MQINQNNFKVQDYDYKNGLYESIGEKNLKEDFFSLLKDSQENGNLELQSGFLNSSSQNSKQDQFGSGIYSQAMSNIYNYRFRGQSETIVSNSENLSTLSKEQSNPTKNLLNSL